MLRKPVTIICLLLCTVYIASGQQKKKDISKEETGTEVVADTINYKAIGAPMPPLRMITDSGDIITGNTLQHQGNTLIMLFNPTCEHCMETARAIIKHLPDFSKTRLLLLAMPEMKTYLSFFDAMTKVTKYPEITMGVDSANSFNKMSNYGLLPQINIYDNNRKLIKVFNGDTPIDSLIQYAE